MGMLPPLQVTVDARSWSVILDVRLALHRLGLMMATRLAEELRVFLVPALWEVLDNTAYLDRHPEQLAGQAVDQQVTREANLALSQWERARLDLGLNALHIFWAGGDLHESSLPKDVDPGIGERFTRLAEDLSLRLGELWMDKAGYHPLDEGSRDAAALAAAMIRYRPVILTLCENDNEPPALCRLLSDGGLPCRKVSEDESLPIREFLNPLLTRSGVLELAWDGLQLAMVHLVAPQALLMTPDNENIRDVFEVPAQPPFPDAWSHASAYWYQLP